MGHGHDPAFAPPFPEGFPQEMLMYDYFARTKGWTPAQVRDLSFDELHWFPIVDQAREEAAARLRPPDD